MPSSRSFKTLGFELVAAIRGLRWREVQIDPVHDVTREDEFAIEVRFRGQVQATLWIALPRPRPFAFRPRGGPAVEWQETPEGAAKRVDLLLQALHFA